jgi:hypothetical protein
MTQNDTSANGDEESGRGKFGDGLTSPLYEFQASRFRGGRLLTPNVIRIWPDRVEEYEYHALRHKQTRAISYQQVSEVRLARGLVWSTIAIESTGGRSVAMEGIPKADAERVKGLLDNAVLTARGGGFAVAPPSAPPPPTIDVADQLRKLAELRDQGILTDEEFAAQKAKLLD